MKTNLIRIALAAAAAVALAGAADAAKAGKQCTTIAAAGSGLTRDLAEIMANGGVKTIADSRGYTPEGPTKMKCENGSVLVECRAQRRVCK
jgi:ABC-type proline/glycine betaine transport system substrate-binding protein